MNEFASALSTALHEEAKEIAMSVDVQQAEKRLRESIRSADRQRRVWTAVGVAAAVLIVVAGVVFVFSRPTNRVTPIAPSPSQPQTTPLGYPLDAFQLAPPLTAQLPAWVATAQAVQTSSDGYVFEQQTCELLCPAGEDRGIWMFSVPYMYPLDGTKITRPTYASYVNAWKDIQRLGYGTVGDVTATTVGGRPATTMTVAVTKQVDGLARCGAVTDPKHGGGCFGNIAGLTLRLAIVDQGTGKTPTLLYESRNTANTKDAQDVAREFAAWLATVTFP